MAGAPVDWFVVLKHSDVTTYLYADASSPQFAESARALNSLTDGAVANTLQAAFKENFALYNDEEPDDGMAWA